MSRYAFGSLSEQQHQRRDSRVYRNELPLPTYDEVMGAAAITGAGISASLKTEVQQGCIAGPAIRDANEDRPVNAIEHSEVHYEPRFTSGRKSSVLVLIGLILIPLCALIIFIQLKGCAVSHQSDGDSLDSLYSKCVDEKNSLLQLIHDIFSPPGSTKLIQHYESALFNKDEAEASLRNLRDQLKILNLEKEKLEWLLAHANKTFSQLKLSDDHNKETDDTTPVSDATVKSDSSDQQSEPAKKKSLQERLSEWSKISPDAATQIESAMQEVQDFIKFTEKT